MARTSRDGTLRKLLEAALSIEISPRGLEAAILRLASVLGKQEILVEAAGVRLSAWLSNRLWLTVSVTVSGGWNQEIEDALYQALKQTRRITAMLVIADWQETRALCEEAWRASQKALS